VLIGSLGSWSSRDAVNSRIVANLEANRIYIFTWRKVAEPFIACFSSINALP